MRPAALSLRDHWSSVVDGEGRALLSVTGLHCANCERTVRRSLQAVPGVSRIDVNILQRRVAVSWQAERTGLSTILQTLTGAGFPAAPVASQEQLVQLRAEQKQMLKRIGLAAMASMQLMMYSVGLYLGIGAGLSPDMSRLLQIACLLITTPVLLYSGQPILAGAWRDLRAGQVGMDAAVSLGLLLAYLASLVNLWRGAGDVYFDSVAMFVLFLLTGRFLEARQRRLAAGVTDALARSLPRDARRLSPDHSTERIAVDQVRPGDRLMVAAGAAFPTDGTVVAGNTHAAESLLTGESAPVPKLTGAKVLGGSINVGAAVTVEASVQAANSTVALLARLLAQQQSSRLPLSRLADFMARYFVGIVILLAAITAVAWWFMAPERAFSAMLAVLVVSCPCALSLAAPAALAAAGAKLARRGILVLRPDAIESLGRIDTLLLDKTGTLTRGQPTTLFAESLDGRPIEQHLAVAAALERHSEHPLALPFRAHGKADLLASNVIEHAGRGVEGVIHDRTWRIGRAGYVAELTGKPVAAEGAGIWLGHAGAMSAHIVVGDALRPGVADAMDALRAAGLAIEIVSGDHRDAVRDTAAQLSIDNWRGGVDPPGKLQRLKELQNQGHIVAMLGDGINDAPVLAAANVSIAMSSGSDLAQAAADLVLLREDYGSLVDAVHAARTARQRVRQNLAWAGVYNLVAIPFAAFGFVTPWLAALGMSLSSLLVVLNATRSARA
jgi:Cu2+-exporting ATPase